MKRKIQSQFLLYFLLLSVCPLLILAAFSYYNVKVNAETKLYGSIQDGLKQDRSTLDEQYARISKYMDIVVNSYDFYNVIQEVSSDVQSGQYTAAQFKSIQGLSELLKSMFMTDKDVSQAMIIVHGRCVYSYNAYIPISKDFSNDDIIRQITDTPKLLWRGSVSRPFGLFDGTYTVVSQNIKNTANENPDEAICQFVLLIDQQQMDSKLSETTNYPDNVIALLDDTNRLLAINPDTAENRAKIQKAAKHVTPDVMGGEDRVSVFRMGSEKATYYRSKLSEWRIMALTPQKYLTGTSMRILLLTALMVCGILAAMIGFSLLMSKTVFSPIRRLAAAMKKVSSQDFSALVPVNSENEIGDICRGFNDMVKNIDRYFKLTVKQESQKREIERNMLKYQINPHFLYNTLNSIRYAALCQRDDKTGEMIMVLSRLLRNTLAKTGGEIHLEQELDNIRDYIFLQQIRYDGGITVLYDVDSCVLDLLVPEMLLQPIVENSILHGLNELLNSSGYAEIRISARIEEKVNLIITVTDNGCGISPEKQRDILKNRTIEGTVSSHIGLSNIHKRIRLQYGEPYGVSFDSEEGSFTCVRVLLPVRRDEKEPCND